MKKTLEICFVGPYNMHRMLAAMQLSDKLRALEWSCALKPLSSLKEVADYIKYENNLSVGLISYYNSNKGIMSAGIDAINRNNLFINSIERFHLPHAKSFKDFFVVSNKVVNKLPKDSEVNEWATLLLAEGDSLQDIVSVESIVCKHKLSFYKEKIKQDHSYCFYLEINCDEVCLSNCLDEMKKLSLNVKVLGSYKLINEKREDEKCIQFKKL